jgi:transcription elongation factor S-II
MQVNEMKSALVKAMGDASLLEATSTMDVLEALQKVNMTQDLLRETSIGKTVAKLKKFALKADPPVKAVAALASKIVDTWRAMVEAQTAVAEAQSQSQSQDTGSTVKTDTDTGASGDESGNDNKKKAMNNDTKTDTKTDMNDEFEVAMNKLPGGRGKIAKMLCDKLSMSMERFEAIAIAMMIEDSMNHLSPIERQGKEYQLKARQLISNLGKNEKLRIQLRDGDLRPEMLPHLSINELATDEVRQRKIQAQNEFRDAANQDYFVDNAAKIAAQAGINEKDMGSMYRCRKATCGSDRTTNYQLQTRSSDEPMTVFVTCLICKARYRC